jgi:hypothetical protein
MVRVLLVAVLLLLLTACEPPTSQGGVKVQALVLGGGAYTPQEVTLTTLQNPVTLEGRVASFIGGARIQMDSSDRDLAAVTTEEGLAAAIVKDRGRPVRATYITQRNAAGEAVLWPADFHTWNLVSAYYGLERAWDYFVQLDVGGRLGLAELKPTTTYYFPDFILAPSRTPMRDNAIFFTVLQSMMVMPFEELQQAPLAINSGVLAHEYAHRIFNHLVYGGSRLPAPLLQWSGGSPTPGFNLLKSMDEGLADYHAYAVTCRTPQGCNPRFLSTSFSAQLTAERDISDINKCMNPNLRTALTNEGYNLFQGKEYQVGTRLAAALYQAGQKSGQHAAIQAGLLRAYSSTDTAKPGLAQLLRDTINDQNRFTLPAAMAVLVRHTDDALKQDVCNELMDRLQIPANQLIAPGVCPASAGGGISCRQ